MRPVFWIFVLGMFRCSSAGCGDQSSGRTVADGTEPADASTDAPADAAKSRVDTEKLGLPCTVSYEGCHCISFVRVDPEITQPRCVASHEGGNNACSFVVCSAGKHCLVTEESDPAKVECW